MLTLGFVLGALMRSRESDLKEISVVSAIVGVIAWFIAIVLAILGAEVLGMTGVLAGIVGGLTYCIGTILTMILGALAWDLIEYIKKII